VVPIHARQIQDGKVRVTGRIVQYIIVRVSVTVSVALLFEFRVYSIVGGYLLFSRCIRLEHVARANFAVGCIRYRAS